jgi:hypothetical protein
MASLFVVGALGCEAGEDEQKAVSVVEDGIALLEEESLSKMVRLTTSDFLVQPGKLNRKAVTARLYNLFRTYGGVKVLYPEPEVEILDGGDTALITMPFVVAEKGVTGTALEDLRDDTEDWVKEARQFTDVQRAEISLVKKDDRWLVRTVRF